MAKMTVNLDDTLLREAKQRAVDEGTTLGRLIERGLRLALDERRRPASLPQLPVVTDGRPPRIDITSRDAMYDALDGRT
jgi:hypothetical protein